MSHTERLPEPSRDKAAGNADDIPHPAGPHAKPELTNEDATPGAGSLPDPETEGGEAGGTG